MLKKSNKSQLSLVAAIEEWEQRVTEWKVIWINFDFVVHMNKVEPSHAAAPAAEPVTDGESSPPAR